MLSALTLLLLTQAVPQQQPVTEGRRTTPAVLSFPDPWLDDSTSYQGYQTRFFRDSKRNTVQVYLDRRSGRAVQLWADAANESLRWFENMGEDFHLSPIEFAYRLMMRSGRIDKEKLRRRDPQFVAAYDRTVTAAGADPELIR